MPNYIPRILVTDYANFIDLRLVGLPAFYGQWAKSFRQQISLSNEAGAEPVAVNVFSEEFRLYCIKNDRPLSIDSLHEFAVRKNAEFLRFIAKTSLKRSSIAL